MCPININYRRSANTHSFEWVQHAVASVPPTAGHKGFKLILWLMLISHHNGACCSYTWGHTWMLRTLKGTQWGLYLHRGIIFENNNRNEFLSFFCLCLKQKLWVCSCSYCFCVWSSLWDRSRWLMLNMSMTLDKTTLCLTPLWILFIFNLSFIVSWAIHLPPQAKHSPVGETWIPWELLKKICQIKYARLPAVVNKGSAKISYIFLNSECLISDKKK